MFRIVKENMQSEEILTQAITSDKFKNNEKARNTIIRANDLFHSLSEAPNNLNVLVNVKNDGTTELRAELGSGYIQVTVEDTTSNNTKVVTGGQIELNDEVLEKIQNVFTTIKDS